MPERFGDLLRKLRRKADKTLGDVARLLGVSVVYVSDVERGNRKPFSNERIVLIARFLGESPDLLIEKPPFGKGGSSSMTSERRAHSKRTSWEGSWRAWPGAALPTNNSATSRTF